MKRYFQRLRHHPGVPVATCLTFAFVVAGLFNENLSIKEALVIGLTVSAVMWAAVLFTNRR